MKKSTAVARRTTKPTAFAYTAPNANTVLLAGDFTHWEQSPVRLDKGVDGVWRTVTQLTPGEHHYRFVVDGQWRDDPHCPLQVPNPYGTNDSVRQVL